MLSYKCGHETQPQRGGDTLLAPDEIANRLRDLRGGIPRENVAKTCGISVSALTMYETGKRIPRDDVKIALAHCYKTSVGALFFDEQVHES